MPFTPSLTHSSNTVEASAGRSLSDTGFFRILFSHIKFTLLPKRVTENANKDFRVRQCPDSAVCKESDFRPLDCTPTPYPVSKASFCLWLLGQVFTLARGCSSPAGSPILCQHRWLPGVLFRPVGFQVFDLLGASPVSHPFVFCDLQSPRVELSPREAVA